MAGLARAGWIAGVIGLLAIAGAASADPVPNAGPNPGPARVVTSDGHVWERIPMRYVDPRSVALILGGRTLPTEMDLFVMRNRGVALPGGYGGGYGGFRGGAAGYGGGSAGPMGMSGAPYGPGAGPMGLTIYGDPNSNSLLVGPGGFPAGGYPGGAGAAGAGGQGRGGLFPGLIIFGDPNSNSLLVDP